MDRSTAHSGKMAIFFKIPDGVEVEVLSPNGEIRFLVDTMPCPNLFHEEIIEYVDTLGRDGVDIIESTVEDFHRRVLLARLARG